MEKGCMFDSDPSDLEFDDSASAVSSVAMEQRDVTAGPNGPDGLVFDDSEHSGSNQHSSSGTSTGLSTGSADRKKDEWKKRKHTFGGEYTNVMRKMRVVLWLVLGSIMILSTSGIYFFSLSRDTSAFRADFAGYGTKILDAFQEDGQRKLEALDSLSALLTIFAIDHKQQWPNVTMPHSAPIFERYLNVIGASALHMFHIVEKAERKQWEVYASLESGWIDEAIEETLYESVAKPIVASEHTAHEGHDHRQLQKRIVPFIQDESGMDKTEGPWAVTWQYAPISPDPSIINYNQFSSPDFVDETVPVLKQQVATMSKMHTYSHGWEDQTRMEKFMGDHFHKNLGFEENAHEPFVYIHYPVFETVQHNSSTVAILSATLYWKSYFEHVLPEDVFGVICVVENTIGQAFTYQVDGLFATFLGMSDHHDASYDSLVVAGTFVAPKRNTSTSKVDHMSAPMDEEFMSYSIRIYPSSQMEDTYMTNTPIIVSAAMLFLFLVTAAVFKSYDLIISRRQNFIVARATKTEDIVASLFPENVRARILGEADEVNSREAAKPTKMFGSGQSVASSGSIHSSGTTHDPATVIADFHPSCSVLFTDIKGFTAWCSEREPSQVFILLETLYNTYDIIAKKRKVFKVETIGDCYMAVTGLPVARDDHAVIMCKFARECLRKVEGLLRGLEVTLGPGTADLSMRFGIHSGPVTAGVIRSQNARFQLFGDTVNTASRMESTGEAGMIQISQETAQELINRGKAHWFFPREDKVTAKGKGELQTFWLNQFSDDDNQSCSTPSVTSTPTLDNMDETTVQRRMSEIGGKTIAVPQTSSRLVDWNVEALCRLLEQLDAQRPECDNSVAQMVSTENSYAAVTSDGISEVELPIFDPDRAKGTKSGELETVVIDQLHQYVNTISMMHNENAFHNFEHASHVAMSVLKLLGRIVIPSDVQADDARHAFSDPLTQFTCVFAALIHDVCHRGVPNAQLVSEQADVALQYNGQSVAEQVSIDVAWGLLMQPDFASLRGAIYGNQAELERFRYLLVHAVMATDIADKNLQVIRAQQWQAAFATQPEHVSPQQISQRRAIIVVQTLMQASDVSHTMQHWHVYRKWNEKFYRECVAAYQVGRSTIDPTQGWYQGEIGFFDHCVIPLAKKLKDCGVFGVSSEEYLNYATKNRDEWKARGVEIVQEMRSKVDVPTEANL